MEQETPSTSEKRLQVLLIETDEGWIAQGLEHDISVESETLADVLYEFERAMVGHFFFALTRGEEPFAKMPPAPRECVDLWQSGYEAIIKTPAFRLVSAAEEMPPKPQYKIANLPRRSPATMESAPVA